MSKAAILKRVDKYMKQLENERKIKHALSRLKGIEMTYDILVETMVGKAVNRLRHHEVYGTKAVKIVTKWRKLVNDEPVPGPTQKLGKTEVTKNAEKSCIRKPSKITSEMGISFADALKIMSSTSETMDDYFRDQSDHNQTVGDQSGHNRTFIHRNSEIQQETKPQFTRRKERTKVYAGRRMDQTAKVCNKVSSLSSLALKACIQNIDMYTNGPINVSFSDVKPILEKCNSEQLEKIEYWNPSWKANINELWKVICIQCFPKAVCGNEETWKKAYERYTAKRKMVIEKIANDSRNQTKSQLKTKVINNVITPCNIQRRQMKNSVDRNAKKVYSNEETNRTKHKDDDASAGCDKSSTSSESFDSDKPSSSTATPRESLQLHRKGPLLS